MSDKLIGEYESRLNKLASWPDKSVIYELSSFALRNNHIANHIADILISRIIDPQTNKSFKVPLFYLVDSMMRNSGGQYVTLFSSHIVVVFQRVFSEANEIDKARLDYLLSTWENRKQLPEHLVNEMRNTIGTRIVTTTPKQPFAPPVRTDRERDYFPERDAMGRDLRREPPFSELELRKQMEIELDQIYNLMGAQTRLPLDQLKAMNSQLIPQIEKSALEKLEAKRKERPPPPPFIHSKQMPERVGSDENTNINNPSSFRNRMIGGFICEQPIVFDLGSAYDLSLKLRDWNSNNDTSRGMASIKEASLCAADRLTDLLKNLETPPSLPALISSNIPPDDLLQEKIAEADRTQPKEKLPVPKFRHDLLSRPPKDALKALYSDRSFYCRQDGMRFKTQAELASHLDLLFLRNQDKQRKEGTRTYRQWYCKESQWITDFGALKRADPEKTPTNNSTTPSNKTEKSSVDITDEDMVLPADEHFTRCPVSNEAFIQEWDTEEGDYMYRNAVKVLLTEKADRDLYKIAQPTVYPLIRYIIVHQKLVMDGWLAASKAASLFDTIPKINKTYGSDNEIAKVLVSAFIHAAGEEEDTNDIFILFESSERGEPCIGDEIFHYETKINQHSFQQNSQDFNDEQQENYNKFLEADAVPFEENYSNNPYPDQYLDSFENDEHDNRERRDDDGEAEMKMEIPE